jgi:hypothetical protein
METLECPGCGEQFELTDNHILPPHNRPDSDIPCPYSGRLGRLAEVNC